MNALETAIGDDGGAPVASHAARDITLAQLVDRIESEAQRLGDTVDNPFQLAARRVSSEVAFSGDLGNTAEC
eukprot:7481997-Pyramimonas_sp.AAC.1